MSALAKADGVTELEYVTVEVTFSGLQGFRVSGTFKAYDGKMGFEDVYWAKEDEAWNVSTFFPATDKKAHQAAIKIAASLKPLTVRPVSPLHHR